MKRDKYGEKSVLVFSPSLSEWRDLFQGCFQKSRYWAVLQHTMFHQSCCIMSHQVFLWINFSFWYLLRCEKAIPWKCQWQAILCHQRGRSLLILNWEGLGGNAEIKWWGSPNKLAYHIQTLCSGKMSMILQCSWMWQASQPGDQFSPWSGVCGEAGTGVVVCLSMWGTCNSRGLARED